MIAGISLIIIGVAAILPPHPSAVAVVITIPAGVTLFAYGMKKFRYGGRDEPRLNFKLGGQP